MISFAQIFFYIHSALCLAYVLMVGKLTINVLVAAVSVPPSLFTSSSSTHSGTLPVEGHSSFGELMVSSVGNTSNFSDDKIINGIMYFVLGFFLLYAEIYMYHIYSLSCVLPL
jgi:hypothetical protein